MVASSFVSLLFLATTVFAGNQHYASKRAPVHKRSWSGVTYEQSIRPRQSRNFTLTDNYEGASFFDNWDFMTFDDPTHGLVQYVNRDEAFGSKLAYVRDDGVAIMKVDTDNYLGINEKRKSVRIHTKKSWTQGLFIADILQMPYGCSTWPAYWSNGPEWPKFGEIDIIEGVHNATNNVMTLHTAPGCFLDSSNANPNAEAKVSDRTFIGTVQTTTCDAQVDHNTGCGIRDNGDSSYGFGLNSVGGGVYATLWNDDGIRIWFFPRDSIPADIDSQTPNPDNWPAPQAFFSTNSCPMSQFFQNHTFIFNITLCGDLGNATFEGAGCPGTCAETVTDPTNFRNAKWKVNYFRVYN